jgi:hypothetical protein
MIRTLFQAPVSIDWDFLKKEISEVCSDLLAINDVSGQVAVYCASSPSQQEIQDIAAVISSHDPSSIPFPPLDEIGALTTLLVVLNIITLEDGAHVIHEEPEHLIAEAEAWSVATP